MHRLPAGKRTALKALPHITTVTEGNRNTSDDEFLRTPLIDRQNLAAETIPSTPRLLLTQQARSISYVRPKRFAAIIKHDPQILDYALLTAHWVADPLLFMATCGAPAIITGR